MFANTNAVDAAADTDAHTDTAELLAFPAGRAKHVASDDIPPPPAVSAIHLHDLLAAKGFNDLPRPQAQPGADGQPRLPDVAVWAGELLDAAVKFPTARADLPGFKDAVAGFVMPGSDTKEAVTLLGRAFKADKTAKAEAEKEAKAAADEGEDLPEDAEAWPDLVDGVELFNALRAEANKYLGLQEGGDVVLPLWWFFAWTLDAFRHSPRLGITSPAPGCGKTTVLKLCDALIPRPLHASSITGSSVFRSIEAWSPSLLIDEADTYLSQNDELRGILNAGHDRSGRVIRTVAVGDDFVPRRFKVWCPMAIAAIGSLPGTLESRSIHLRMRRLARGERRDKLDLDPGSAGSAILLDLKRKLRRWAADNMEALRCVRPAMPSGFQNRLEDNWQPLLAIADLLGGSIAAEARLAALALTGGAARSSQEEDLLADLRAVFSARRNPERIATDAILHDLNDMQDRPWSTHERGGKPLSPYGLAKKLKEWGVVAGRWREGTGQSRGYFLADLQPVFDRYLEPLEAATVSSPEDDPDYPF